MKKRKKEVVMMEEVATRMEMLRTKTMMMMMMTMMIHQLMIRKNLKQVCNSYPINILIYYLNYPTIDVFTFQPQENSNHLSLPGFMSRVPGASFSYIVSITQKESCFQEITPTFTKLESLM